MKVLRLGGIFLAGLAVLGVMLAKEVTVYGKQAEELELILPNGIMQLYAPIDIEDIQYYRDGGTIGINIRDRSGKKFKFCLDGRMQMVKPGESAKPNHLYFGAVHPSLPGAQSLPIGGQEEKSILRVLQAWLDEQLSLNEQERLLNLDTVAGLSEKEIRAYRILKIVKTLKDR